MTGGAVKIDVDGVVGDRDRGADADGLRVLAQSVEEVLAHIHAIGQFADRLPHHRLRVRVQSLHIGGKVGAVALDERDQSFLGSRARGDLRAQVSQHLHGLSRIGLDQAEQGAVGIATLVQSHQRDAQALLLNFRGVDRDAPRHDAAEIGVMRNGRGIADQSIGEEDRLQNINIGQMLPAGAIGVVGDEDVAGLEVLAEPLFQEPHDTRE